MSVSTEAEARRRLRSATGRIAVGSRVDRRHDKPDDLPKAREDHAAAIVELAIIRALAEAPAMSAERRALLAEMLTAGESK